MSESGFEPLITLKGKLQIIFRYQGLPNNETWILMLPWRKNQIENAQLRHKLFETYKVLVDIDSLYSRPPTSLDVLPLTMQHFVAY